MSMRLEVIDGLVDTLGVRSSGDRVITLEIPVDLIMGVRIVPVGNLKVMVGRERSILGLVDTLYLVERVNAFSAVREVTK